MVSFSKTVDNIAKSAETASFCSYAAAAYSAAVTSGQKEAVSADLAMLSTVFEKDTIESYFSNPFVTKGDKLAAIQSVAGEAGLSDTTLNLFGVMAENNRMNLVSEVAEVYARIIQADAGTVPCSVESAIPLTASQQADVADALQGMLKPGQTAQISTSVNEELMGGMIVNIGDKYTEMKYIDMSVASKVKKYTDLLRQSA
jgi:F-type H+-transporting ATPase subunit O